MPRHYGDWLDAFGPNGWYDCTVFPLRATACKFVLRNFEDSLWTRYVFLFLKDLHNVHLPLGLNSLALSIGNGESEDIHSMDKFEQHRREFDRYYWVQTARYIQGCDRDKFTEKIGTKFIVINSPIHNTMTFIKSVRMYCIESLYTLSRVCMASWSDEMWQVVS